MIVKSTTGSPPSFICRILLAPHSALRAWIVGAALSLGVIACGDDGGIDSGHGGNGAAGEEGSGEAVNTRVEQLAIDLSLRHVDGPPASGTWEARILATRGVDPVDGLDIAIEPWMPGHGHGTPAVPVLEPGGDGWYDVRNIRYTMPGTWELRLTVLEGDAVGHAAFRVTVR